MIHWTHIYESGTRVDRAEAEAEIERLRAALRARPLMSESSPQPSTRVEPSHEAMVALGAAMPFVLSNPERREALTAAYAIDFPARLAEAREAGVAEGRAAMRDEIVAKLTALRRIPPDEVDRTGLRAVQRAIEAAFPTEVPHDG